MFLLLSNMHVPFTTLTGYAQDNTGTLWALYLFPIQSPVHEWETIFLCGQGSQAYVSPVKADSL